MKTIGAFDAKTRLSRILAQVERGESFVITKRGKPVASLSPIAKHRPPGPKDIIDEYRRRYAGKYKSLSIAEIIELKNQGRK